MGGGGAKPPLYSSIWRLHLQILENPEILWFRVTFDPNDKNINRCSVQVFVLERSAVHVLCRLVVSVSVVVASDGFALKYRRPSIQSMIWSWVESIFNKSIVSAWNRAACTPGHHWPCNPYKQKWPEKSLPQDKTTQDKGKKSRRDCHDLWLWALHTRGSASASLQIIWFMLYTQTKMGIVVLHILSYHLFGFRCYPNTFRSNLGQPTQKNCSVLKKKSQNENKMLKFC